eukprot:CAMPEP_0183340858 /NCGR_PEP_ID=MMETSP0164_2-20130417/7269_1 /TAXON_ID=221442 /ORGANISM="Coccolithus pelagicus ssp braarudi, Strain PLY182g" /LENGTH=31 /DNA_ID= /DNA_START= /DNA_END= /DNA_ORIENTATION=
MTWSTHRGLTRTLSVATGRAARRAKACEPQT